MRRRESIFEDIAPSAREYASRARAASRPGKTVRSARPSASANPAADEDSRYESARSITVCHKPDASCSDTILLSWTRQRVANFLDLRETSALNSGRSLDLCDHLRRRDRKPTIAARPQARRMRFLAPHMRRARKARCRDRSDDRDERSSDRPRASSISASLRDSPEQRECGRGEIADVDPHFERRRMRHESAVGSSRAPNFP